MSLLNYKWYAGAVHTLRFSSERLNETIVTAGLLTYPPCFRLPVVIGTNSGYVKTGLTKGLQQRGLFRNYTGFPITVPDLPGTTVTRCNVTYKFPDSVNRYLIDEAEDPKTIHNSLILIFLYKND